MVFRMQRITIFDRFFRAEKYWQTVPFRRLTPLLCAIFCLFGMIGFVMDLFALGQKPIVSVLAWTIFTGLMAVAYLLVITRAPRWILLPVVAHVLGSWTVAAGLHHFATLQVHPSVESGVKNAGVWILVLSMLAIVFFLVFIQREGRQAVRIQTELALAHGIQQTLVPRIDERFAGLEIYGVSIPSEKVGGDLVDVMPLEDGSVLAYVADVAGHGLAAGILMGMLKTAIRTQLPDSPSLTALFQRLNEVLPALKEPHTYATCAALRISRGPDQCFAVEYAIAGQPPLLHLCAASRRITTLSDPQFPIGLVPGVTYSSRSLDVRTGDLLAVATDGLLDAEDASGEAFGLDRLTSLVLQNSAEPLATLAERIHQDSHHGYRQEDDQTLLLIRFAG